MQTKHGWILSLLTCCGPVVATGFESAQITQDAQLGTQRRLEQRLADAQVEDDPSPFYQNSVYDQCKSQGRRKHKQRLMPPPPRKRRPARRWSVWAEGLRHTSRQAPTAHNAGYYAKTQTGLFGIDTPAGTGKRWGLTGGLSHTEKGEDQINSLQIGGYGKLEFNPIFLEGFISYAFNHISQSRGLSDGSAAAAKYNAHNPAAKLKLGWKDRFTDFDSIFFVSGLYSNFYQHSYTERGSTPSLLRNVSGYALEKFEAALGYEFIYFYLVHRYRLEVGLHVTGMYDWHNKAQVTRASMTNITSSFTTQGFIPPPFMFDIGLQTTLTCTKRVKLRLMLDRLSRSNFVGHNFSAKLMIDL